MQLETDYEAERAAVVAKGEALHEKSALELKRRGAGGQAYRGSIFVVSWAVWILVVLGVLQTWLLFLIGGSPGVSAF